VISIARLLDPEILKKNKEKWLAAYLRKQEKNPRQSPDPRQYGHKNIRDTLRAMSFHKCFYCERKLIETEDEVDHYVEVAEKPGLAFEWNNLYLCCPECNRKLPNKTILVSECSDPCDLSENPADHLTFDCGDIMPKASSAKGMKTVQKYHLNRISLNYLREKELRRFCEFLLKLKERQRRDGGRPLTDAEKEAVDGFGESAHAFSLMFNAYLEKLEL